MGHRKNALQATYNNFSFTLLSLTESYRVLPKVYFTESYRVLPSLTYWVLLCKTLPSLTLLSLTESYRDNTGPRCRAGLRAQGAWHLFGRGPLSRREASPLSVQSVRAMSAGCPGARSSTRRRPLSSWLRLYAFSTQTRSPISWCSANTLFLFLLFIFSSKFKIRSD